MKLNHTDAVEHYEDYLENDKYGGAFYGADLGCGGEGCYGCGLGDRCYEYKTKNWNSPIIRLSCRGCSND